MGDRCIWILAVWLPSRTNRWIPIRPSCRRRVRWRPFDDLAWKFARLETTKVKRILIHCRYSLRQGKHTVNKVSRITGHSPWGSKTNYLPPFLSKWCPSGWRANVSFYCWLSTMQSLLWLLANNFDVSLESSHPHRAHGPLQQGITSVSLSQYDF